MLRSAFTASVPAQIRDGKIYWCGCNEAGTLIYCNHYYYSDEKLRVKVHRVSVFGGPVHEIGDFEFFTTWLSDGSMFYRKPQRLVWYHQVDPIFGKSALLAQNSVVIFNIESSLLKRYYANIDEEVVARGYLMCGKGNVLILLVEENEENKFRLYEVELNNAEETFSLSFIVKLFHEEYSPFGALIYYCQSLVFHPSNANLEYLFCYEFQSGRWSRKDVLWECEKPEVRDLRSFCGDSFVFDEIGKKFRLIKLDINTFTWKEMFTVMQLPQRACYSFRGFKLFPNGMLHYAIVGRVTEKLTKIRIEVHCRKSLPLKYLCLRSLWLHVRQISYKLSRLSDHDLCDRLMLSSVLNVKEYFGQKIN